MIKNKKGGFEMSITTLVVIVIAVVMLILGLVFVKQIFKTAYKSESIVDQQVRSKLQTMFGEEGRNVVVYSNIIDVKAGTSGVTIPFAARKQGGGKVSGLEYEIILSRVGDCESKNPNMQKSWFVTPLNTKLSFDSYEVDVAYGDIILNIPKDAVVCSQRVQIKVGDVSNAFTLNVKRGGL